ncbi:uncharacterized protein LOC62_02G002913 [Vanrija pseudolonga]|uniref:Uncharacterized protein n=1 Tax=Vanrija pseudolonga TaxID=143232 RepID=A0AAF0Y795_9TREE|nr:hypothetical protein LOC62_02G002913 [Vanrija pseudolonga]
MPKLQTAPTKPARFNPIYAPPNPAGEDEEAAKLALRVRRDPLFSVLETVERTYREWQEASKVVKDLKVRRDAAKAAMLESSKACRAPVTELEKQLAESMSAEDLIAQVEDKNDNKEAWKRAVTECGDAEVHAETKRLEYMDAFALKARLVAREAALRNRAHHASECTLACARPNAKPVPDTHNCDVCHSYVTAIPTDMYTKSDDGVVAAGILIASAVARPTAPLVSTTDGVSGQ